MATQSRKAAPKTVAQIVTTGDYRRSLEALRDRLAQAIDGAEPSVIAQIAGRLQAVLAALAALPSGEEKSISDDLARRREAKLAAASTPAGRRGRKPRTGGG